MRYNKIRKMDISNGDGIRISLFLQGCHLHCKGCFNQETWDFNGGKEFTENTIKTIIELCKQPHIQGLSILGGEPLEECNIIDLLNFLNIFKKECPDKDVWLWTGYTPKNMSSEQAVVCDKCDKIITGPFIESLKDPILKWRGSSNQEIWVKSLNIPGAQFIPYEI